MRTILFLGLLFTCFGGALDGQQKIDIRTVTVPTLLNFFAEEQLVRGGAEPAMSAIYTMLQSETRTPGEIAALISGLVDLVRNGQTAELKVMAVIALASSDYKIARTPNPRVVPLLIELFWETETPGVRPAILYSFMELEHPEIGIDLFRRVLTEETPSFGDEMEAGHAVAAALASGAEGHALLRELHEAGSIHDLLARSMVSRAILEGRLIVGG